MANNIHRTIAGSSSRDAEKQIKQLTGQQWKITFSTVMKVLSKLFKLQSASKLIQPGTSDP